MEELTPLEESIYNMFTAENVEMKELERKIYARALAENINNMIEEAYKRKEEEDGQESK